MKRLGQIANWAITYILLHFGWKLMADYLENFGHICFNGWKLVILYRHVSTSMLYILARLRQKQMADYLYMIGCQIGKGMVDKNGNIWPYSTTFHVDDYKARVREW